MQKVGFTGDAYKPGLAGMERLSALLGDPWRAYPCVHVAGTNGKGSVCSMLAAALAGGGAVRSATATHGLTQKTSANCPAPRHVGLYTSPHLQDFRERMKIVSGDEYEMISREEVWEFLNVYEAELEGLSFFEVTTGMAFWWFAKRGVNAAVIEAGLGGRLDSTNIITPVLSVITSIGLDHCALLGSTRSAIAWEKAGIFKPGVPAVVGVRDDETAPVFEAAALVLGTPLTFASDIPEFDGESDLLARMDLTGPCQNLNLHTVLVALAVIASPTALTATADNAPPICDGPLPLSRGWRRSCEAIPSSAKITGLWGRWQLVCREPEVICDIGHNPPALKENFGRLEGLQREGRNLVIVYGIMADKDLAGIAPMMPADATYILTAPDSPRSMPAEELAVRLAELRPEIKAITVPAVADAVRRALTLAQDLPKPLIYIGGSTFVVAEALPLFNETTEP
ncbi:MAG: bifunctional folylpolyglutamate synthase/dihydrofolate synthase [Bacteroidales bacterium]|nr:bifunctional folylpolyglutamate synthase/dihydrofolate synthase [Bacteroidales bacterium]